MSTDTDPAPTPASRAVKRLRLERGWTQVALAAASGLDRVEVSNLETGRNLGTSARVQLGLARAFGLPAERIAELLAGKGGADGAEGAEQVPEHRGPDSAAA